MSLLSPAIRDALEQWLTRLRAVEGAAENTVTAYRGDVTGFLAFLSTHHGGASGLAPLARITGSDMRAWMAHERGRGEDDPLADDRVAADEHHLILGQ